MAQHILTHNALSCHQDLTTQSKGDLKRASCSERSEKSRANLPVVGEPLEQWLEQGGSRSSHQELGLEPLHRTRVLVGTKGKQQEEEVLESGRSLAKYGAGGRGRRLAGARSCGQQKSNNRERSNLTFTGLCNGTCGLLSTSGGYLGGWPVVGSDGSGAGPSSAENNEKKARACGYDLDTEPETLGFGGWSPAVQQRKLGNIVHPLRPWRQRAITSAKLGFRPVSSLTPVSRRTLGVVAALGGCQEVRKVV